MKNILLVLAIAAAAHAHILPSRNLPCFDGVRSILDENPDTDAIDFTARCNTGQFTWPNPEGTFRVKFQNVSSQVCLSVFPVTDTFTISKETGGSLTKLTFGATESTKCIDPTNNEVIVVIEAPDTAQLYYAGISYEVLSDNQSIGDRVRGFFNRVASSVLRPIGRLFRRVDFNRIKMISIR